MLQLGKSLAVILMRRAGNLGQTLIEKRDKYADILFYRCREG